MGAAVATRLLQITDCEAWQARGRGPRLRQLFGGYQNQDCWGVRRKYREIDDGNGYLGYDELQQVVDFDDSSLLFFWDIFNQQDEFVEARELMVTICIFSSAALSDKARFLASLFDAAQCGLNTGAEVAQMSAAALGVLAKCSNMVVKPRDVQQAMRSELPMWVADVGDAPGAFDKERVIGSTELDAALESIQAAYKKTPLFGPPPAGSSEPLKPVQDKRAPSAGQQPEAPRSLSMSLKKPLPKAAAAPVEPAGIAGPPPEALAHVSWLKKLEGESGPAQQSAKVSPQRAGSRKVAPVARGVSAPPGSAHVWLVIPNGDFATVAKDLPGFRRLFVKSVASALGLPSESVDVVNVTHGSLIVEFFLHPSARSQDKRPASALVLILEQQIANQHSALRKGALAQYVSGAQVLTGEPRRAITPHSAADGQGAKIDQDCQTEPMQLQTPRLSSVQKAGNGEDAEATARLQEALRELQAVRQRASRAEADTEAVLSQVRQKDALIEELRVQVAGGHGLGLAA